MTRQLLAFSRRQPLERRVLDLNAAVQDSIEMLDRLIGEDIEMEFIAAPDLGRVRADPGQLQQVVLNLAINARDAIADGGELTIETANVTLEEDHPERRFGVTADRHVMLSVTDTGCGMDRATLRRIFEPFFTTKEPGRGTGLGLATAYGVVKQHGGNIAVQSEPGQGTTFQVYLPLVEEEADEIASSIEPVDDLGGSETLLLVEDDNAVRSVIERGLESHGYEVLVACAPNEAAELFSRHNSEIDLLLTDVVMPKMDGPTLYRTLSGQRESLRVLYMSGYSKATYPHHDVLEAGSSFIAKPFTPAALARKVRRVLDG